MATISNPENTLYVGDLDISVTEDMFKDTFSKMEGFESAVLRKDDLTGQSRGFGFVHFETRPQAKKAMETKNYSLLKGKAMRIMWWQDNRAVIKSGVGDVFVKNLHNSIDTAKLHEKFSKFGNIFSCKISVDKDGKSKGYGYVQFETEESAEKAIKELNGKASEGKQLHVVKFKRRSNRVREDDMVYTNLYVKCLPEDITETTLKEKFSKFGEITSMFLPKSPDGAIKGYAFVNFEKPQDAKRAKESLHRTELGSKVLYVARAQKKSEREKMLRRRNELKLRNVYVKNINKDVDDTQLKRYFSQCGRISNVKIMRNDKGTSKGFGFVCFSKPEEASTAISRLNGLMFYRKPLYVSLAQNKKERMIYLRKMLQCKGMNTFPFGYGQQQQQPVYQPFGYGQQQQPVYQPLGYGQQQSVMYQRQSVPQNSTGAFWIPTTGFAPVIPGGKSPAAVGAKGKNVKRKRLRVEKKSLLK